MTMGSINEFFISTAPAYDFRKLSKHRAIVFWGKATDDLKYY